MAMVRVTGRVVRTDRRSGTGKNGPWTIREARVMIGQVDFCDVRMPDDMPDLRQDDAVDLAVEYTGEYRGVPSFQIRGDWSSVPGVQPEMAGSSK
jgi:hypothetical protein